MIQVAGFSLEAAVGYYAAKKQVGKEVLVTFSIAWSVFATVATVLLVVPLYQMFAPVNGFPTLLIAAYVGGNLLISFGNALCFSSYRFVLPHVIAVLINAGLILMLITAQMGNVASFSVWYFNALLLHGLILMACIVGMGKTKISFPLPTTEQWKLLFRFGSRAFLANLLFFLLNRVDYLFVRQFCAPSDLGNYIQVSKIAQMFFMLPSMIATVLFPVIAGATEQIRASSVTRISASLGLGYVVLLLILVFVGKQLFPWLYGESFSAMYLPFVLQAPGIIAVAMLYPYAAYNSGHNRIRINTIGTFIGLVVLLTGDLLLIPEYGIKAAAAVSSLGYCCYFAFLLFIHKRKSESL